MSIHLQDILENFLIEMRSCEAVFPPVLWLSDGSLISSGFHKAVIVHEFIGGNRSTEKISLYIVTAVLLQIFYNVQRSHLPPPLSMDDRDHGAYDHLLLFIDQDVRDQRAIRLYNIRRKLPHIPEG